MAEDEEGKAAAPAVDADPAAAPAPPAEAAVETSQPAPLAVDAPAEVPATTGAVDAVAAPAAPAPAAPAEPPNKLYEWGAAVGIMMFLVFVLWFFLNFFRSTSL